MLMLILHIKLASLERNSVVNEEISIKFRRNCGKHYQSCFFVLGKKKKVFSFRTAAFIMMDDAPTNAVCGHKYPKFVRIKLKNSNKRVE